MGIQHIEDLKPDAFISFVRNIHLCSVTEKLDGTNVVVGRQSDGSFYTTRSTKGDAKGHTYVKSYDSTVPANHGYMFVHEALMSAYSELDFILPGQAIECEILFGRQPNAIVYGTPALVFLAPAEFSKVPFTDEQWKRVQDVYLRWSFIPSIQTTIDDNHKLVFTDCKRNIAFSGVPWVDAIQFAPGISDQVRLNVYEDWLTRGSVGTHLTNRELLDVNLTSIPVAQRPVVKMARETARIKSNDYKLGIKEYMLEVLANIAPKLRSDRVSLSKSEDFGVEGVVAVADDGTTVKIVNKRLFTAINAFNHMVRNAIKRTSHGSIPDGIDYGLDLNIKGRSLYDNMLEEIAQIHGIDGFKTYMGIKPAMRRYVTNGDMNQTIDNIAGDWSTGKDIILRTPIAVRGIINAIIRTHLFALHGAREHYITYSPAFYLRLDRSAMFNGSEERLVGYSRAVHDRTMIMFAEVEREYCEIMDNIRFADDLQTIVAALFQKQLLSIH